MTVNAPAGVRDYNFIVKSNSMTGLTQKCSTTTGTEPCWATINGGSNVKAVDRYQVGTARTSFNPVNGTQVPFEGGNTQVRLRK